MATFTHKDENGRERVFSITPSGIYESSDERNGEYISKDIHIQRKNEWEQLQKIRMVSGIYEMDGWEYYGATGKQNAYELQEYWENYHEHTTISR